MANYSSHLPELLLATAPWLLLGSAIGAAHLASLRWNIALFLSGGSMARALLLQAARLALLAGPLAFAALNGATALLATAGAILLVRAILLRQAARRGQAGA